MKKHPLPLVRCLSRKRRRWPCLPTCVCEAIAGIFLFSLLGLFAFLIFGLR